METRRDKTDQRLPAALPETVPWASAPVSSRKVQDETTVSANTRLRQSRLRAAAVFLAGLTAVGLVWSLIAKDGLWPVPLTTGVCLFVAIVLLSKVDHPTRRWLRLLEFVIFGVMAANLIAVEYHQMLDAAVREDIRGILTERRNTVAAWMSLIFAYAIFLPNTWRSALPMILLFAVAPIATEGLVAYQHPEVYQFADASGMRPLVDWANLVVMLIGAALGTYGTHVLSTLRQDVFEARRLNQYQLGELLGRGGMGEVYRAEHRLLKRPCAVKLIHPAKQRDRLTLSLFEKEVRAAARLSHPNIVDIYDYGHTDEGAFYYVMEYLDGLNLAELVERDGPLPPGRVIDLLRQVCDGLAEAHAAGLIHRDLKPANIFVASIGRRHDVAKILDFGLVWHRESGGNQSTHSTEIVGTPAYMAPEQIEADPTMDHHADIYALGCVCYYLMTGRPPFIGLTPIEVMMAHVHSPVVPPSQIAPAIDEGLEHVVLRCLSKEPSERFGSANELNAALLACVENEKRNSVLGSTSRNPAQQPKSIDR